MTLNDATSRIETGCRAAGLPVPSVDDTEKLILIGLQQLANREQNTDRRSQFQKAYSAVTLTSGAASLSALTDLLVNHISDVVHSDTTIISLQQPSATTTQSQFEFNSLTYRGWRESNTLVVKQGDTTNAPDGTISFKGGFTPTLVALLTQYDDDLIAIVVGLVAGGIPSNEQTVAA